MPAATTPLASAVAEARANRRSPRASRTTPRHDPPRRPTIASAYASRMVVMDSGMHLNRPPVDLATRPTAKRIVLRVAICPCSDTRQVSPTVRQAKADGEGFAEDFGLFFVVELAAVADEFDVVGGRAAALEASDGLVAKGGAMSR